MTRTRLKNCFLKDTNEENWKLFCKQRNKWILLLRKSKNYYFENLNEKNITDNKRFWKTVKPFLSKKNHLPEGIILTEEENNSLLKICEEFAKGLNYFLANTVNNLNILNYYNNCDSLPKNTDDPTLNAIAKWRNHPSILAITS